MKAAPIAVLSLLCLAGSVGSSAAQEIGVTQFPEGEVQLVVRAGEEPWRPCPPGLPAGCEMAVLEGDPQAPDLFTIRFRVQGDFEMPPHWHPKDERVTIVSGKALVAFGTEAKRENAEEFGPGDYYVNRRNETHVVWIDGPSVLQITGIGPWEANPVEE